LGEEGTMKFRAWDIKHEEMMYIDDLYWFEEEGIHEIVNGEAHGHHSKYKIMWYTGLNDKNDKEIYEGDMVEYYDWGYKKGIKLFGNVVFYNAAYWIELLKYPTDNELMDEDDEYRVMGNVYENPSLLN
jgi:uncharacterized phage protein (TIGR01671 family)